jgi:hypothetical protein
MSTTPNLGIPLYDYGDLSELSEQVNAISNTIDASVGVGLSVDEVYLTDQITYDDTSANPSTWNNLLRWPVEKGVSGYGPGDDPGTEPNNWDISNVWWTCPANGFYEARFRTAIQVSGAHSLGVGFGPSPYTGSVPLYISFYGDSPSSGWWSFECSQEFEGTYNENYGFFVYYTNTDGTFMQTVAGGGSEDSSPHLTSLSVKAIQYTWPLPPLPPIG